MLPEFFFAVQLFFSFDLNILSDEPLDPMIVQALEYQRIAVPDEHNAFVYFLGIVASENDDSLEIGKQRFAAMNATSIKERRVPKVYPKTRWPQLDIPGMGCLSRFSDGQNKPPLPSCYEAMNPSCSESEQLLSRFSYLLPRFQTTISLSEMTGPKNGTTVHYDNVEFLHQVSMLDNFAYLHRVKCKALPVKVAAQELADKTRKLRRLYQEAGDIVLKLGFFMALRNQYDWMVYQHQEGNIFLHDAAPSLFSLQSREESSLRKFGYEEILTKVAMMDALQEDQEAPKVVLFKENMTLNRMLRPSRYIIYDSEIPIEDYLETHKPADIDYDIRWWRVDNLMGEILIGVSMLQFWDIALDFNNLDLLIRLSDIVVNHSELIKQNTLERLPMDKRNPYDRSLPYLTDGNQQLCFNVPVELEESDICIYLH